MAQGRWRRVVIGWRPGMAGDWVSDGPRVVGQGVVGYWIGIEAEGR